MAGERATKLLHLASLAQPSEIDDEEPALSNSPPTSDWVSASSPERKITR